MSCSMRPILTRAGFILALGALPLLAQAPRLKLDPLDRLAGAASEVVDVTLDGSTLRTATRFLDQDPSTRALTRHLEGIYVKSLEFDKPGEYSPADLDAIRAQMPPPAWSRIVQVQSKKDGHVEVFLLGDGHGGNLGLVVLAAEAKELTVVNIVGAISLQELGSLEGKFGIPPLGPWKDGERHGGK